MAGDFTIMNSSSSLVLGILFILAFVYGYTSTKLSKKDLDVKVKDPGYFFFWWHDN